MRRSEIRKMLRETSQSGKKHEEITNDYNNLCIAADKFYDEMDSRIMQKLAENYLGWDDIMRSAEFRDRLYKDLDQRNYLDVAIFCMFLNFHDRVVSKTKPQA